MFVLLVTLVYACSCLAPATAISRSRSSCVLPAFPANGWYNSSSGTGAPGDVVRRLTVLEYSCSPGYFLTEEHSVCSRNNIWSPKPTCAMPCKVRPSFTMDFKCYTPANEPIDCDPSIPEGTSVRAQCKPGHVPVNPHQIKILICTGGKLGDRPTCKPVPCKVRSSFTMDFKCYTPANEPIDCDPSIPEGTSVRAQCKPGHVPVDLHQIKMLICTGGKLGDRPTCKPDCGLEKPTLSFKSTLVEKDIFPWQVAIYQKTTDPEDITRSTFTHMCGGSIIHSHVIISAAHCFWDPQRQTAINETFFRIAAGKYLRSWDDEIESHVDIVQKREIKEILLHEDYRGGVLSEAADLAIVVLKKPLIFSNSIRAVCYNIENSDFDDDQLENGTKGKVAGWGIDETGKPSKELKSLELPVISKSDCRVEMQKYKYNSYLTQDKFCAGYIDAQKHVCQGDSGGGLVFSATDGKTGRIRWYLRGVAGKVPVIHEGGGHSCQADTYAVFTRIFSLRDWLDKELTKLVN